MNVLAQAATGAKAGTGIANAAAKGNFQPLVIVGGVIALIIVFVIVVKLKRNE